MCFNFNPISDRHIGLLHSHIQLRILSLNLFLFLYGNLLCACLMQHQSIFIYPKKLFLYGYIFIATIKCNGDDIRAIRTEGILSVGTG